MSETPRDLGQFGVLGGTRKEENRMAAREATLASMPPLTSIPNALKRLELISNAAITACLAGSQAMAASRATEVWLRTVEDARVKKLERQLEALQAELAALRQAAREGLNGDLEFVLSVPEVEAREAKDVEEDSED